MKLWKVLELGEKKNNIEMLGKTENIYSKVKGRGSE